MKFSLLLAPFVLVACTGAIIPEVTPQMASEMEVSASQLESGRALYVQHCNRCHNRVFPGALDAEYWRKIVPHMAQNAQLKEGDDKDILLYLMAAHNEVHGVH